MPPPEPDMEVLLLIVALRRVAVPLFAMPPPALEAVFPLIVLFTIVSPRALSLKTPPPERPAWLFRTVLLRRVTLPAL